MLYGTFKHFRFYYILFCDSRHPLSIPTVRLDQAAPPLTLSSFYKDHFLILDEADLEQSATVIEKTARMFNQYPVFTIILSTGDHKYPQVENKGNSPLVFINPQKVGET